MKQRKNKVSTRQTAIAAVANAPPQDKFPIQESEPLNVVQTRILYPQYENIVTRINTFVNWPIKCKASPSEFASCGFWYVGVSDMVQCFHCGIVIKDWLKGNIPLDEHYRQMPGCSFINKISLVAPNDFPKVSTDINSIKDLLIVYRYGFCFLTSSIFTLFIVKILSKSLTAPVSKCGNE